MTDIGVGVIAIDASAIPLRPGGAGRYVRELVAHLPAAGIDPLVITRRGPGEMWPGNAGILSIAPDQRPRRLLWEQIHLADALDRRVRVLHSPHYTMPRNLSRKNMASVVTIHDLTFFSRPKDHRLAKRHLFRLAIQRASRNADVLIAVSESTAEALIRLTHPLARIEVIAHGVDHDRFRPSTDVFADREIVEGLGIDRPFVVHVGTIEPRKNLANLLRAYEILCARMKDPPALVFAGSAWPGAWEAIEGLVAAIANAHPSARIVRLGLVDEDLLPALYRRASVVAYPSFEEGFGLPAIEALACGTPVVTSVGSVMEELAGEGVIAIDPHDPTSIADGIDCAIRGDGPAIRDRIRVAGRYRWETSAAAHADVYRSVL